MKCTPGTRFQFHLLNSRLIVYICVMRNFNKKKNALGVARLSSRRAAPLAGLRLLPPPSVSNYLPLTLRQFHLVVFEEVAGWRSRILFSLKVGDLLKVLISCRVLLKYINIYLV